MRAEVRPETLPAVVKRGGAAANMHKPPKEDGYEIHKDNRIAESPKR